MARLPRLVVPGLPHLVIHRGHNGTATFVDDADRRTYLDALRTAAADARVAVHGYGMFDAEVRLLATPTTERSLALMMQAVGRRYVRAFNLRHGRRSSPWEGRFRSAVVEPGPDVWRSLLVVEGVAGAGLQSAGEASQWSSAAHHLGLRRDPLITEHPVYWTLGNTPFEREIGYRRLAEAGLAPSDVQRVLKAAAGGWALASPAFAAALNGQTGRRAHPLARGRPTRSARITT